MSNSTIENVYTRQAAKELTRKHFWKLLGIILAVAGITFAATFITLMLAGGLGAASGTKALAIVLGLITLLAIILLASGLELGMTSAMLHVSRNGDQLRVSHVFSRMGQSLKAFGLSLWVGLKTMLWALPGYVLMFFAFGGLLFSVAETTDLYTGTQSIPVDFESLTVGMMLLPFLCMIVIFALVIPAVLRYMLSICILADKPETGVFDCVRQSKALMKGHKWQAFKLAVPVVLLMLLAEFLVTLVYTVLIALLGQTAITTFLTVVLMIGWILLNLFFTIRLELGYCIFYTKRLGAQQAADAE